MGIPGPKTTLRYSERFKASAVKLSRLPGVSVQDVAESLYIHPLMLSRWRKQAREGVISKSDAMNACPRTELSNCAFERSLSTSVCLNSTNRAAAH
jgi:transposase